MIREPRGKPHVASIPSIVDQVAMDTMRDFARTMRPIVVRHTPRHSGQLTEALTPRTARTKTGRRMTIAVPKGRGHRGAAASTAQVLRWVGTGTGIYREGEGPKRKIRSKRVFGRMSIYGKKVWTVKGQHAQHFMVRIQRAGDARFPAASAEGAQRCARELERAL